MSGNSHRFHPVCADPARRRALPSPDAARRAHRAGRDHDLQGVSPVRSAKGRAPRTRRAPRARMGGHRQPRTAADRLRAARPALRGQRRARSAAARPARRRRRRLRPAGDHLRAVVVPRQHRRRAHRRDDGQDRLSDRAHRLPGGDRRGVECRRFGQRGRRHDHDDDVDRRRLAASTWCTPTPPRCRRCWCAAGWPRASSMRTRRCARRADRARRGLGPAGRRRGAARRRAGRQHRRQRDAPALATAFPVLGVALWAALLVTAAFRRPDWAALPAAITGAVFLLSLVLAASMMPVERLPNASWVDGPRPRLRLGGVRQHPADGAGAAPGRLRLGHVGLRGRLRRLDDLVRLVGRRGGDQRVPRGQVGGPLAAARLARGAGLRRRLRPAHGDARVAAARTASRTGGGAGRDE